MLKQVCIGMLFSLSLQATARPMPTDTLPTQHSISNLQYPYSKSKVRWVAATNIIGYGGTMVGLYHAWYKNYPQSSFHVFNDWDEWRQMDKIGHMYSAYIESLASMELWRFTGIDRKKAIWLGGLSGAVYQTTIEILDGFSRDWGWSWGDIGANFLGSGLILSQALAWDEQKVQMKFSFHRKSYNDPILNQRSNKLFGNSTPERLLKDYNGQTYWLSVGLHHIFPQSNLPKWLQFSIGTGVEGVFGARGNYAVDDNQQVIFDKREIPRIRQWYLAPDIDLTKIRTNKKGIKLLLSMLNVIKIPAPSLELKQGKLHWNWLTF